MKAVADSRSGKTLLASVVQIRGATVAQIKGFIKSSKVATQEIHGSKTHRQKLPYSVLILLGSV